MFSVKGSYLCHNKVTDTTKVRNKIEVVGMESQLDEGDGDKLSTEKTCIDQARTHIKKCRF